MKIVNKSGEETGVPGEDIECLLWCGGHLLSSGSGATGAVKTWSPDLKLIGEFQAHDYPVYHMTSGENANTFYTCSSDCTIRLWDAATGDCCKLLKTLEGHKEAVRRIRMSGNRLFSGDEIGEIKLWEDGKEIATWCIEEEIFDMIVRDSCIYSVRDRDLTINEMTKTGDRGIRLCNKNAIPGRGPILIINDKLCFVERGGMHILVHSANESRNPLQGRLEGHTAIINTITGGENNMVFSSGWDKKVIAWDINQLTSVGVVDVEGYVNASAMSPDGTLYVAGENSFITAIQI